MKKILLISLLLIPQVSFAENLLLRDPYTNTIDIETTNLSKEELTTFIALAKKLKIKTEKALLPKIEIINASHIKGVRSNNCKNNMR